MHITVRYPKGLIAAQHTTEFERSFGIRTHLHVSNLDPKQSGIGDSAKLTFEEINTDRKVVHIIVDDTPFSHPATPDQRAFCDRLELSMSEILDTLEISMASVEVILVQPDEKKSSTNTLLRTRYK
jgi:hypothetical protein